MAVVSSAAKLAAIEAINDVIDGESTAIVPVQAVAAAARRHSFLDLTEEQLQEVIITTATARYLKVRFIGLWTGSSEQT